MDAPKFCSNCGGRLATVAKFCSACGNPVVEPILELTPEMRQLLPDFETQPRNESPAVVPAMPIAIAPVRSAAPPTRKSQVNSVRKAGGYTSYSDVPWYRRSVANTWFIVTGFGTRGVVPLTLVTCILLLTGDVYYKATDIGGQLRVWSKANKIAAGFVLLANLALLGFVNFRSGLLGEPSPTHQTPTRSQPADSPPRQSAFDFTGAKQSVVSQQSPPADAQRANPPGVESTARSAATAPNFESKGWTEESTNSTEAGPWLQNDPPGTRYWRDYKNIIFRVYPPGVKPNAAPANPFGLNDSAEEVPPPYATAAALDAAARKAVAQLRADGAQAVVAQTRPASTDDRPKWEQLMCPNPYTYVKPYDLCCRNADPKGTCVRPKM